MRLFQIEYMMAVSRNGSISKAADELLVSRPAVSKALSSLESEYKMQLFSRTTSGVELTEAGYIFYEKCTQIQKQLHSLHKEMQLLKEKNEMKNSRHLRVSLSPAAGYAVFPNFCSKLFEEYPDITLEPLELSHRQSTLMLAEGTIDVRFCSNFEPEETSNRVNIIEFSLCFCCNRTHRLAGREYVSIEDIADEYIIRLEGPSEGRDGILEKWFKVMGREPKIKFHTAQLSMMQNMVASGLCCCIQFREVMQNIPEIVTIPFKDTYKFPVVLEWNPEHKHNSAFDDIVLFAKKYSSCY